MCVRRCLTAVVARPGPGAGVGARTGEGGTREGEEAGGGARAVGAGACAFGARGSRVREVDALAPRLASLARVRG